ncbi:hypothetical protein [Streptomyces sp. NPDC046197]|uniref:hypothetical protein n=1 Tax=Streptomyces sp. NPDC046197 TaxID=3154337 RepID=UPI0033F3EAEF
MDEPWLDELAEFLRREGYALYEDQRSPGGAVIRFRGHSCEIHITNDRGDWWIGLSPLGSDLIMTPQVWAHYIDGTKPVPATQAEPLDVQITFVKERLKEAELAAARDPDIDRKLIAINRGLLGFDF